MTETDQYNIKSLEKSVNIINLLLSKAQFMSVPEIARQTKLSTTTTFRILKTFQSCGWVYQNREDKYSISTAFWLLTQENNFFTMLKEKAYPIMKHYTNQEDEVMNLSIRSGEYTRLLLQTRTSKMVDYVIDESKRVELYASASGKVILSDMSEEEASKVISLLSFKAYTPHTITTPQALREEIRKVRARGYAMDICESLDGACCISVPIRTPNGKIVAALSFSGFTNGLSADSERYYFHLLNVIAREIYQSVF